MAKKSQRIAIAYDFDGTLAPGNMQQHSFIPKLGVESSTYQNSKWVLIKEQ